jgi:EmrB/QacA subfamily drug resistance transporter
VTTSELDIHPPDAPHDTATVALTQPGRRWPAVFALVAALIGFFLDTLDTVVVNVALPSVGHELHASITGLQWVVDGYTLMFAALLLSAGALSDRAGARRAFGAGLGIFVFASLACGLAPNLPALIAARFLQGSAAAIMIPSSLALISQAYPEPRRRARAVALWSMGGSLATTAGPIVGGLLTGVSWRLIFLINVPVGLVALMLLRRVDRSPRRPVPFDLGGQILAMTAIGALTFGTIHAGAEGLNNALTIASLATALAAAVGFVALQRRSTHPMLPLDLFRTPNVTASSVVGFAWVVGYFGVPFVISLYLQEVRGLSPLEAGMVFLPMTLAGAVLVPFIARIAERTGVRPLTLLGFGFMTTGLLALAGATTHISTGGLALLMVVVGVSGPLVIPPVTGLLLNSVPDQRAGTASGLFNTSRQVGSALAVAIFGGLLAQPDGYSTGITASFLIAAVVSLVAGIVACRLRPARRSAMPE